MIDKIKEYIIKFAIYEEEPLHIVLGAIMDKKIIGNAYEAVQPILELIKERYLDFYYGSTYKEHNNVTEDELIAYIKIHEPEQFNEYPELEYYLQTTSKGRQLFPDAWKPLSSL
jgi:hypothetical protein